MFWPTLFVLTAGLLVAALVIIAWLYANLRASRNDADRLMRDLGVADQQHHALQKELADLRFEFAKAEREAAVVQETKRQLEKQFDLIQKQSRESFEALAGDALKKANEQFLQLARKSFESEQKDAAAQLKQREQAIKSLVDPIKERLDQTGKAVSEIEKQREGAYRALREQLGRMIDDQRSLRDTTANLAKALRRPEVRGRWGEMQLRRVAELAGMIDHCDFTEQVDAAADGEVQRPDMIVHLPSHRQIVIDAKTPIDAYLSAIEADDDAEREQYFDQHLGQIETQVGKLASKRYQDRFRSADFVVLFIPGDSFLQPAVQQKPMLLEQAMTKGVVIATPSTLIALLKAVELGWREQKLAENAQRVRDLGVELHARLGTLVNHMSRLGKALNQSVDQYNKTIKSIDSRVLVSARKFSELGADSGKPLPGPGELPQIEPRPELPAATE